MSRSKIAVLARSLTLLASVGAPCLAQAADLLPPPPPPPMPAPVEVGGGWYLRGDVGASIYSRPAYSTYEPQPINFYDNTAGSGAFAGVGVGYQFNEFFRGDVTGEYRFSTGLRTNSYSDINTDLGCDGVSCTVITGRNFNTSAGLYDAAVVLANAYFDLGTWYGITPFIGGGAGVAINRTFSFTDTGLANLTFTQTFADGSTSVSTATNPAGGAFKDKTTTSFAWALHAGLAYNVTEQFKVEIAYRYLNLGHAATGILNCFCGQPLPAVKVKDLEAHDVKIGVRYLLGGGIAAPLPPLAQGYAPGPIVSKY